MLVLILKGMLKLDPRNLFATKPLKPTLDTPSSPSSSDASSTTLVNTAPTKSGTTPLSPALTSPRQRHRHPRARPSPAPATNGLYPASLLDSTTAHFLSLVSPQLLSYLPPASHPASSTPLIALSAWTPLYTTSGLTVAQHPTVAALYSVEAAFPGVPIKALYETLLAMDRRSEWDSMCAGAETIDEFSVGGRRGNVIWMGMKGMAFVKAKDMVLLSVAGRLPPIPPNVEEDDQSRSPTPTSDGSVVTEEAPTPKLRLFCATTSFGHPARPPTRDFARMKTSSGFVIEDDGQGGSRILQLTDLSGLGSCKSIPQLEPVHVSPIRPALTGPSFLRSQGSPTQSLKRLPKP